MSSFSSFSLPRPSGFRARLPQDLFPHLRPVVGLRKRLRLLFHSPPVDGLAGIDELLRALGVTVQVDPGDLRHIPREGAFLAMATQPGSLLETLVLLRLVGQVRSQVRAVAPEVLPPLLAQLKGQFVLGGQPEPPDQAPNEPSVRQLLRLLHNEVPLLVFPAGTAAARPHRLEDRSPLTDWDSTGSRILTAARVPVLPIWFSEQGRPALPWWKFLAPLLRSLPLPLALLYPPNKVLHVRVGAPVTVAEQDRLPVGPLLPWLRAQIDALSALPAANPEGATCPPALPVPVAPARALLEAELATLPPQRLLAKQGNWEVYHAKAAELPHTWREIWHLGKQARLGSEPGTQFPTGEDAYQAHAHQVFLYDRHAGRLVGAYRLGLGRTILRQHGRPGFGLHALFHLKKELEPLLQHSVEVRNAFIRAEYQAQPLPHVLLWQGLAAFLGERPHYHYLIGTVTLQPSCSSLPKAYLLKVAKRHGYDAELAAHVRVRQPFRYYPLPKTEAALTVRPAGLSSGPALETLLTSLQPGGIGVPSRLRPYFCRHLRFLGFHLSPAGSNSLAGFALLDTRALLDWTQQLPAPGRTTPTRG